MTARYSRILRIVPFIIICLVSLPACAKYSGGSGTGADPYQIATAQDLIDLGNEPNDYDKHFILTENIDLSGILFDTAPVAAISIEEGGRAGIIYDGTSFTGVFDGNGHTISHLTIVGSDFLGLFGQLDSTAQVKDLGVVDVNINGTGDDVGALAGSNEGDIITCYGTGEVSGNERIGGLIGSNSFWVDSGTVTNCSFTGTVTGNEEVGGLVGLNFKIITESSSAGTVSGNHWVGGLVGSSEGEIHSCYSRCEVDGNDYVGGFIGCNPWNDGNTITNCYCTGAVTGDNHVGGFAGSSSDSYRKITRCYSTGFVSGNENVGGFVGCSREGGTISSFWDVETSGLNGSDGGVGLTTAEMMDPYMLGLNGFANDSNWVLNPGLDYPRLAWEGTPGQMIPEPEIDWLEGNGTAEYPYQIKTANQLILLGKASILCDKNFVLGADIDLDPNLPDGQIFGQAVIPEFSGIFDGNDHVISNLTISGGSHLGLFGQLEDGAEVKDLGVVDVNVTGSGDCIGGLAGYNYGDITDCYSSGVIIGNYYVGGLAGHNESNIITCYSTATVNGNEKFGGLVGCNYWRGIIATSYSTGIVSGKNNVGGLVGENDFYGSIINSYSTGSVSGNENVGGFVGDSWYCSTIMNCYSTGSVNGNENVGGFAGGNYYSETITNCYSTGPVNGNGNVGGFVGYNKSGDIASCFWDVDTSGRTESDGGEGRTTTEMMDPNTFITEGWDFVGQSDGAGDLWAEPEGGGYPILYWQLPAGLGLPEFSGGTGEPDDPYLIATEEDLNSIGHNPRLMSSHFKLINDLDVTDMYFYSIGSTDYPYCAVFNGNGHTVSNVTIEGESYLGFFSYIGEGAEVENLGVVDVNITGSYRYIGGLAGRNGGDISNCYVTGELAGGDHYVGGLIGYNYKGTITASYSDGLITGTENAGGLIGYNYKGEITTSNSDGLITGTDNVGGLVGRNCYGTMTNNYSNCSVTGDLNIGGLVGYNYNGEIFMCYSSGAINIDRYDGGLSGGNTLNGIIAFCFWDKQTSGKRYSYGGEGKTTAEMQTKSTFTNAGWDFEGEMANGTDDIWWIDEGNDYPRLWWETETAGE